MLNKFIKSLRKESLLDQVFKKTIHMFDEEKSRLSQATTALMENKRIGKKFLDQDESINLYEIRTRKKILEYLALNQYPNLSLSLILTSVARELERLGDNTKSIAKLARLNKNKIKEDKYCVTLRKMTEEVLENFDKVKNAFANNDKKLAKEVMDYHNKVMRPQIDKVLKGILADKKIKTQKAVICSLYSRYLKRVSARQKNIATAVTHPYPTMYHRNK